MNPTVEYVGFGIWVASHPLLMYLGVGDNPRDARYDFFKQLTGID